MWLSERAREGGSKNKPGDVSNVRIYAVLGHCEQLGEEDSKKENQENM